MRSASTTKGIVDSIRFGWKTRRAWWYTALSRSKERFSRTALGSFWLGLSNLLSIAALSAIYSRVLDIGNFKEYVLFLGIGLAIWEAIGGAISSGPNLFKANKSNLQNSNTNPIFYTLEEWAFNTQTFAQSFTIVFIALSFFNHSIITNLLTHGIAPAVNIIVFIYWLPIITCLLGARLPDLYQFIPVIVRLIFLLSPILYPRKNLGNIGWIAEFNPIYRYLEDLRYCIIYGESRIETTLILTFLNIAGLIASLYMLEKNKKELVFLV